MKPPIPMCNDGIRRNLEYYLSKYKKKYLKELSEEEIKNIFLEMVEDAYNYSYYLDDFYMDSCRLFDALPRPINEELEQAILSASELYYYLTHSLLEEVTNGMIESFLKDIREYYKKNHKEKQA